MPDYKYQEELSKSSPILLDREYKKPKIEKMLSILNDAGVFGSERQMAVDIGCSGGLFTESLAPYFEKVIGLDIDIAGIEFARLHSKAGNVEYIVGDSMALEFPDCSVDLVFCNHVYEHVPDAHKLFEEIHRVLKSDGVCYLGAASRLIIMEPHYHLPFLSWLPKAFANLYMKLSGKGDEYYENLRTYWGILALLNRFEITDYTLSILEDPDKYSARDMIVKGGVVEKIPLWVWRLFRPFLPTYIFILRKAKC